MSDSEDGTHRRENITDWALEQFRSRYHDPSISKWDIFHYVYAVLHHSEYRERYAANLRRELPRIPFVGGEGNSRSLGSAESLASERSGSARDDTGEGGLGDGTGGGENGMVGAFWRHGRGRRQIHRSFGPAEDAGLRMTR
jgi:hypothetical protein